MVLNAYRVLPQGLQPLGDLRPGDTVDYEAVYRGLACSVALQPAVGARGSLRWAFTGTLASGASGSVTLRVTVD